MADNWFLIDFFSKNTIFLENRDIYELAAGKPTSLDVG